jgi:hypothetical protein
VLRERKFLRRSYIYEYLAPIEGADVDVQFDSSLTAAGSPGASWSGAGEVGVCGLGWSEHQP